MTNDWRSFKGIHAGQSCVVICNGKSLADVKLDQITVPTIGVNRIYLRYTPHYYVVEDHLVAEDCAHDIAHFYGTTRFYGTHLNYIERLSNDEAAVWYPTCMDTEYPAFPNWYDGETFYTGGTVTYQALQLAFYMGFVRVYCVGLDHNYVMPDTAKAIGADKSIYLLNGSDPNHFDPSYFTGRRFHAPLMERMELAYRRATQVYTLYDRELYNATPDTQLPDYIMPRCDLDEVYR